jgi:protein-S-isoprenylcysteine O-methyltransferase Ste14
MYVHVITGLCLIIFWLYWMVSAASARPIQVTRGRLSGNWYSILLVVGLLLIVSFKFLARFRAPVALFGTRLISDTLFLSGSSMVVAVVGLAVVNLLRRTLGSNWRGAVALKAGHELVTEGIYDYVRHPIYTGVLTMAAGVALSYGPWEPVSVTLPFSLGSS